jgi:hypothetical protein
MLNPIEKRVSLALGWVLSAGRFEGKKIEKQKKRKNPIRNIIKIFEQI